MSLLFEGGAIPHARQLQNEGEAFDAGNWLRDWTSQFQVRPLLISN
jgi:hypothetical protein